MTLNLTVWGRAVHSGLRDVKQDRRAWVDHETGDITKGISPVQSNPISRVPEALISSHGTSWDEPTKSVVACCQGSS